MITVSEVTKKSFLNGAFKNIRIEIPEKGIVITNNDILFESLEIEEAIENGENLSFIGCIASSMQFECAKLAQDVRGLQIYAKVFTNTGEQIPLFCGYVDEQENQSQDDYITKIVAYDPIYKIGNTDVSDWYNGIHFPTTIKDIRDRFFNHFGIYQETVELPQDRLTVEKTIEPQELSGYDIISQICQMNARFGRMTRTGTFEYINLKEIVEGLYPSDTLYPADDLYPVDDGDLNYIDTPYYESASHEPFNVDYIDKVVVRTEKDDVGAIAGTGENALIVENNLFLFGKGSKELSAIAEKILEDVQIVTYMPCEVSSISYPWLECGDNIQLVTKSSFVYSYILNRRMTGIQLIKDAYSAKGTKRRDAQIHHVNSDIIQLQNKTNTLTRTVDETKSELKEFKKDTEGNFTDMQTTIKQTAEKIEFDASKKYETKDDAAYQYGELNSSISITAKQIKSTVASNTITYDTEDYKISLYGYGTPGEVGYDPGEYKSQYYLDQSTGDLYYSRNTYWQKIKTLKSVQESLKSSITQTASSITQSVSGAIDTWDTSGYTIAITGVTAPDAQVYKPSDYNGKYYLNQNDGKVYRSNGSEWKYTAQLTTKLSKVDGKVELKLDKDGENGLVSVFNAKVNQFTVKSDYFTLTKNGKITASEVDLSGKITATSGKIAGWSIEDGYLYSNDEMGAGLSDGKNTSHVVFWAGASKANCANAPFRVSSKGTMYIKDYLKTSELEAEVGKFGYITATTVEANYATIDSLDAATARIETIEGKYITAETVKTTELNADYITSGTISANRIAASTIKTKLAACKNVYIDDVGLKIGERTAAWRQLMYVQPGDHVLTGYLD